MKLHASKVIALFVFGAFGVIVACSSDGSTGSSDDALKASCTKASDCHGALPDICERCSDGTSACAHFECVSGKCETVICPATKPECEKASDCKGALPDICEKCSGGGTECAHWECESGKCETVICGS